MFKMKRWAAVVAFALALATPAFAQSSATKTLSSTACPGSGCVTIATSNQGGVGVVALVPSSFSGQFDFQVSMDGQNWQAWNLLPGTSTTGVSSGNAAGGWSGGIGGMAFFRVIVTSYVSGSVTIQLQSAPTSARSLSGGGGGGGSPGGSNGQVQYNASGSFGGISGATTNGTTLTLVAPVLGTPASVTLTNATGLPIATGVSGLGTGVATALAVNTGSAGAFVVNGGALGTPSSATLTSATGLPISTGVSGLGTGVATALAVNTGSAGAFVVNGGALGTPSSGTLTSATGYLLSNLAAAGGSSTLANGDNPVVWNWATTTSGRVGFNVGETTASTSAGTPYLLKVSTLIGSTATPLNLANSLNGSQTLPALSVTPTWNTTGVANGLFFNATNTASNSVSRVFDFQASGASQVIASISGNFGAVAQVLGTGFEAYVSNTTLLASNRFTSGGGTLGRSFIMGSNIGSGVGGIGLAADYVVGWSANNAASGVDAGASPDTMLRRDGAANTIAQRNSTNAQTFRLYNTYTDASNYERWTEGWSSNVYHFGAANAGTGTARVGQWDYGGTTTAAISVPITSGAITFGGATTTTSGSTIYSGTAIPAGGTTGSGYKFTSTSNFGVFFGSGAPTLSAAKGSLYLRSDGSTTNDRAYINTDGSTTWTALTTGS